jgi:hypothetical protein
MPTLRRRAKKLIRKKYKKTIKLTTLDKIWKEYCEFAVIRPLIKDGVSQLDNNTKLEIVGKKIVNYPNAYNIMSKGLTQRRGGVVAPPEKMNMNRSGFIYKIRLTDKTFKRGQLVYKSDPKLAKRVNKALVETLKYYRIEE